MKKRTVTLLLSLVLSLSLFGCGGNSAEPKQETQEQEIGQEQEQEKTEVDAGTEQEEKEQTYIEHEFLFVTEKATIGEEKIDMDSLEPNGQDFTLTNSVDIYGSRGGIIGYTKPNINVHVVTSNEDWYCLFFEQEEPTYQYVLVRAEDFLSNSTQAGADLADSEETVGEPTEASDPYDEILTATGYDKDKTYTTDEYIEILTKILEEMGKENNPNLNQDFNDSMSGKKLDGYYVTMLYKVSEFEDHEKTLENTKEFMSFAEYGFDGNVNVTEFTFTTNQKDGKDTVNLIIKQVSE